jgi:hypothetical protein
MGWGTDTLTEDVVPADSPTPMRSERALRIHHSGRPFAAVKDSELLISP